ncbi:MAG: nucleoside triphosphate pyrophosphohydrolase, partial [Chloroflexota bacterium]|nr:nucleoside triphosphate pyrophosphohydrolase [Chloroflexota bacterium]
LRTFASLRRVVAILRGPEGCPWDRVQTHETLRPYLVEETAETIAALDEGDPAMLCKELGDLLFQVLIHVQLAEERGEFRMPDVIGSIAGKLVRRHPHVFSDAVAETPGAVIAQWDDLKKKERGPLSALAGIPEPLPALAYAQAVQRRVARAGFSWDSDEQAWGALEEELGELRRASTPDEQRLELGDAVFALANLARRLDLDAEDALRSACRSFTRRFNAMEAMTGERGIDLRTADIDTKLALWEEAKAGTGGRS